MLLNLVDVYILVYLDNNLSYLAMAKDHTGYARAVFEWLAKSKYNLKYRKHALILPEVEFLRYSVFESRVLVSPGKVSAI